MSEDGAPRATDAADADAAQRAADDKIPPAQAWLDDAFVGRRMCATGRASIRWRRTRRRSRLTPTPRLFSQTALLLHTQARYDEAEPLLRRALAIDEASLGSEHCLVPKVHLGNPLREAPASFPGLIRWAKRRSESWNAKNDFPRRSLR